MAGVAEFVGKGRETFQYCYLFCSGLKHGIKATQYQFSVYALESACTPTPTKLQKILNTVVQYLKIVSTQLRSLVLVLKPIRNI